MSELGLGGAVCALAGLRREDGQMSDGKTEQSRTNSNNAVGDKHILPLRNIQYLLDSFPGGNGQVQTAGYKSGKDQHGTTVFASTASTAASKDFLVVTV